MNDNINVNVSGPMQPTSTYKTKVLKCNLPFAEQVTEPNMKYVIKYDFVLDGYVTIPANCVLEFDGGKLSNGIVSCNDTIIISNQKKEVVLDCVLKGTYNFGNTSEINKFLIAKTSGQNNDGVVCSIIGNPDPNMLAEAKVCGFSSGPEMTRYPGRDSVALYTDNCNYAPTIVEGCTFSEDEIICPANYVDFTKLKKGDYIDVFDNGFTLISTEDKNRWTSLIDEVFPERNAIKVQYGGFYKVTSEGSDEPETPAAGSTLFIGLVTKVWAVNTNVFCRPDARTPNSYVSAVCGYELDVNIAKEGVAGTGLAVVNTGDVQGEYGVVVEGSEGKPTFIAGLFSRGNYISFLSRDPNQQYHEVSYVLRHDVLNNGFYVPVGYIDKDFIYHQEDAVIDLKNKRSLGWKGIDFGDGQRIAFYDTEDAPCVIEAKGQTLNINKLTINPGSSGTTDLGLNVPFKTLYLTGYVVINGIFIWADSEGYLRTKASVPSSESDGDRYQKIRAGQTRPISNLSIGEMFFDTTLGENGGKPIWYVGNDTWVDATGATV